MPSPFTRAQRGAALLTALLVVVVITVLVMGAIALTSSERDGAVQHTKVDRVTACKLAARNRVLSQIRVLQGNVKTISFDEPLSSDMRIKTGHYDVTADVHDIVALRDEGSAADRVTGISNRFNAPQGGEAGAIDSAPYRISVVCTESNGNQHEVEFVVRVGI